jgi:membrane protein DedA with SNARE-associated domain
MGYIGIFILMTIESAGIPIPSEIIMTYAGFMASSGGIPHLVVVAFIGSLGTAFGSAIGYMIGAKGGKPFVDQYGKYFGLNPQKMLWAEKWFCKYGESACIYTRLLPVVRTIVNIPAGMLGMNFYKFVLYSMLGAFPWCLVLSAVGYILGENWNTIMRTMHTFTYAIVALIVLLALACAVLYVLLKMDILKWSTVEKYIGFIWRV